MKYLSIIFLILVPPTITAAPSIYNSIDGMESSILWYEGLNAEYTLSQKAALIVSLRNSITNATMHADALTKRVALLESKLTCPVPPTSSGPTSGQVSWETPATRMSGIPLSINEIGGFYLYYGTDPKNLNTRLRIPDRHAISYIVNGLLPKTDYYFSVSVYDNNGAESDRSSVVMKRTP